MNTRTSVTVQLCLVFLTLASVGVFTKAEAKRRSCCRSPCQVKCMAGYLPVQCPSCRCIKDPCLEPHTGCGCGETCTVVANTPRACKAITGYTTKCVAKKECETQCYKTCPYGFKDECPRCTCAQDPCMWTKCSLGFVCDRVPSDCYYAPNCPHKSVCKPSDCLLDYEVGKCKGSIPRYYYNHKTFKCEKFYYGGCGGNGNNFRTLEDCDKKCYTAPAKLC